MKTIFLRALEANDKAAFLRMAIREPQKVLGKRFEVNSSSFAAVPRSPFGYWVSEKLLEIFASSDPMNSQGRLVVSTNPLNDDFRYVRVWWEISAHGLGHAWKPWAKGGAYSPFYYDIDTVINWDGDRSTYAGFLGTENRPLERPASVQHFFRPALTWPRRTQGGLSLRAMPTGCIFADKGPAAFVEADDSTALLTLLAIVNSMAFRALVDLQMAFGSYEVGVIQRTPIPNLEPNTASDLACRARRVWALKRSLDTSIEISHAFLLPALLQVDGGNLETRANTWTNHVRSIVTETAAIRAEIDARCFGLYSIDEADQRAIMSGFGNVAAQSAEQADTQPEADTELDDDHDIDDSADTSSLAAELVSWAVAVALGRFDVRIATGARPLPAEPEPFEPLPACSPAMLTGDDGLPLTNQPAGYPIAFAENGLLADDPGDALDLTAAVRAVFNKVFKENADTWWNDVAALLDPKDHDLQAWLAARFFERHLKRHSKSRRKAPIIWQLAVPSGRYSVWLYAHRVNRDTFIQIQNDIVAPKLVDEERRLASLIQSAGANSTSKESKEIETQEAFVGELRDLLDKVKRVAPLWRPTLDDGVVLTIAPLWQLVPQHKSWQKELKSKWDELTAGKYDWAHIAMHLWPERVVAKCAEDRSLAIAHGLEDVFWFEDEDSKWKPYKKPQKPIANLVNERTSAAVKAALKSLLDSPESASGTKRSRKPKAA